MSAQDNLLKNWLYNQGQNGYAVKTDVKHYVETLHHDDRKAVMVLGSGASLQKYAGDMKTIAKKYITICGPTTLPWFMHYAKAYPDLMMNIDVHEMLPALVAKNLNIEYGKLNILLSPSVHPDWNRLPEGYHNKYWFLNLTQAEDGQFESSPYSVMTKLMFPHITTFMAQMGCVTNEAIWIAFSMLGQITADRLVLAGADFSYLNGKTRIPKEPPFDVCPTEVVPPDPSPRTWGLIKTNQQMLQYTHQLALIQKQHKLPIWDMSNGLMNKMFPRVKNAKTLNFEKPWSLKKTEQRCEDFLKEYRARYGVKK